MRNSGPTVLLCAAACALMLLGCSDDSGQGGWPDGLSGTTDTGPQVDLAPTPDLGALPDGLPKNADGPKIEVLAPKAGETVLGNVLTVKATITDDQGIQAESVVAMVDDKSYSMSVGSAADTYEAKVDVSQLTKFYLYVVAEDLDGNQNSSDAIVVERDPGPAITVGSPKADSSHKGSVSLLIVVTDKVEVTSFEARIGSVKLTQLANSETDPKRQSWTGTVKFDDPMFSPPLSGTQVLTITAANKNGAVARKEVLFNVDDEGPSITVSGLSAGQLVGGVLALQAKVEDTAGVIPSSVKVVIGNDFDTRVVQLTADSVSPTEFAGQFDTRTLSQYDLWPVISFRAADQLGNESHFDIQVGLDNGQPIVELDPPGDFYMVREKDGAYQCSHPFDPVGPLAASDGQLVPQVQFIRARVEDQGNHVPSAPWIPISLVDKSSVRLYVLDDTTKALVTDTDGDGYCDDINPDVIPKGSNPQKGEAVAVNLSALSPSGSANFFGAPAVGSLHDACSGWGDDTDPPASLCGAVAMTLAKSYTGGAEPSIYIIPPAVSDCCQCTGLPFDFLANSIDDGWVCVAAVARDNLGSRGVSQPIRLWVDKSATGPGTPPASAGPPPACGSCKFRDPRASSYTQNANCSYGKCDDCGNYECPSRPKNGQVPKELEFPQTFCHCRARLN